MWRTLKKIISPTLIIVSLPGIVDDTAGWGKWLDVASRWIQGIELLAAIASNAWAHYALLGVGILLLVPWHRMGSKFGPNRAISENARKLYESAGILQSLYDWGLGCQEQDNPSAWLSRYVDFDEDTIIMLGKEFPGSHADDYMSATDNINLPPGGVNREVYKKLERLRGKIRSLRSAVAKYENQSVVSMRSDNMQPRIIKTEEEYERALAEVGRMIALDPDPQTEDGERLELLSTLVEKYELEYFPFEDPDPIEAIRFRMEQQDLKQRDLVPYIGSRGKVSEVLSGKRTLSMSMVRALNKGLGIPAEILIQEGQRKKSETRPKLHITLPSQ